MSQNKRITITVLSLLGVIALMVGLYAHQFMNTTKHIDTDKFQGTFLDKPREVVAFSIAGTDNQPFDNQKLKGHWTYIFFGFTNCGYLCPTTMAELGKMYRLIENKGSEPMPEVVMISIDPEKDSLVKLGQYVKSFDRHFLGARGDEKTVSALSSSFGVTFEKLASKTKDASQYDFQHSGTILLINPQGKLQAFFTMPHQAKLLADDYLLLIS